MDPSIAAVIITGCFLTVGTWVANRNSRVTALETRMDRLAERLGTLTAYAQTLRDHIYRGDPPPPPDWPQLD